MVISNRDFDWEAWCDSVDKMEQQMNDLILEEMYAIGQNSLVYSQQKEV